MAASSSGAGIPEAIGGCGNLPSYNHTAHNLSEGKNLPPFTIDIHRALQHLVELGGKEKKKKT
jgi:hypothetical protein